MSAATDLERSRAAPFTAPSVSVASLTRPRRRPRRPSPRSAARAEHVHAALLDGGTDEPEDLLPGADVDALRRLVEEQQPRLGLEPLCEQRLLLVAARQRAVRQRRVVWTDVKLTHQRPGLVAHPPSLKREPIEVAVEDGERQVLNDRERADAPVGLPVSRNQRDAGPRRRRRRQPRQV